MHNTNLCLYTCGYCICCLESVFSWTCKCKFSCTLAPHGSGEAFVCVLAVQTVNTMMYLDNPYPKEGKVIVLNLTSQLVDSTGRPIPLSDVCA